MNHIRFFLHSLRNEIDCIGCTGELSGITRTIRNTQVVIKNLQEQILCCDGV